VRQPDSSASVGLCANCRHSKLVVSAKGGQFWLCERSRTDRRYPKYPRLPVLECPGYEPLAERPR
jgi:hypothetical protein